MRDNKCLCMHALSNKSQSLHDYQFLMLVIGHLFLVTLEKSGDLAAVLGVPLVYVFVRRLWNVGHSERLPADV
jgi:hypothetical protein